MRQWGRQMRIHENAGAGVRADGPAGPFHVSGSGGPNGESTRDWEMPPADFLVDSTVVAVLTRFGLRRRWHLLQTFIAYRWLLRRVRRAAPEGLP